MWLHWYILTVIGHLGLKTVVKRNKNKYYTTFRLIFYIQIWIVRCVLPIDLRYLLEHTIKSASLNIVLGQNLRRNTLPNLPYDFSIIWCSEIFEKCPEVQKLSVDRSNTKCCRTSFKWINNVFVTYESHFSFLCIDRVKLAWWEKAIVKDIWDPRFQSFFRTAARSQRLETQQLVPFRKYDN